MEDIDVDHGLVLRDSAPRTRGHAVVPVRTVGSFHMWKGSEEPTEFGYFLLRAMAAHEPPLSQAELARRVGIGQATISRWIFKSGRPEIDKLELLAPVLGVDRAGLMTIAGYGAPSTDISEALAGLHPDVDPLAAELSDMLSDNSPLGDTDRDLLRQMVERLMEPYRKTMRRRHSA